MKSKQLIRKLKQLGVEIDKTRGKGGHQLAKYQGRQATIPIHGDADIGPQFIRMLCKQLGINPDEIF